jgi:branched-chain amino acid transport system permease protein
MEPLSNRSNTPDLAIAIILALGFASVPMWADKGLLFLASVLMANVIFALSFNLIFGLTGMVSFGHAAFFATGAYTTGYLLQRYGNLYPMAALIASGFAGAITAAIVAAVALRRSSGVYFAILTLALAELVHVLISKSSFLGRQDGLTGIKRPTIGLGFFRVDLSVGNNLYYFTLVSTLLMGAAMYVLWHSRHGRILGAIRQDADRVSFLGVNVHAMRLMVFIASGAIAGFAGGMYAPTAQLLTPDIAHWGYSALPILFCLVGGASYFWGPVLGAIVFVGLEHMVRNISGLSELIVGLVLLLVVLAFPGGLMGALAKLQRRLNRSPAGSEQAQAPKPDKAAA